MKSREIRTRCLFCRTDSEAVVLTDPVRSGLPHFAYGADCGRLFDPDNFTPLYSDTGRPVFYTRPGLLVAR